MNFKNLLALNNGHLRQIADKISVTEGVRCYSEVSLVYLFTMFAKRTPRVRSKKRTRPLETRCIILKLMATLQRRTIRAEDRRLDRDGVLMTLVRYLGTRKERIYKKKKYLF